VAEPTAEEAEFYPTPSWAVQRMLEVVTLPWHGTWLDPCCGDGAIQEAVADTCEPQPEWYCMDVRATEYTASAQVNVTVDNYLQSDIVLAGFDACVMNPPFSLATAFASRAMGHCRVVVMLQRLNWLATEERATWMRTHTPSVYVLPNRCSFTGNNKTDSQEYAWFVWGNQDRHNPRISILGSTSREERLELS
jgi:predicted RNA methylase